MSQAAGSMDEVPPPNQATTPSSATPPSAATTPSASSSGMANREAARETTRETAHTHAASPLAATRRPGLVTFAAVMMFILAGFQFIWALIEFSNAHYLSTTTPYGDFSGYLWAWGVFDLLLAVVIAFAGVSLLRGGVYGQIIGLVVACISAIRWFFYIPAQPWMALAVIGIDILIIYGLVAHTEYFGSASDSTRAGAV